MPKEFSLPDVETIDEVPEPYRPFYFEKDGKVQKQNPAALASTLAKIRREKEQLANDLLEKDNKLAAFIEALGDDADPEVVKQLKAKAAKADTQPTNEEFDKRVRLVEENFKKIIGQKDKEIAEYDQIVKNELIDGQIRNALAQADANKDGLDILPAMLRSRVELQKLGNGKVKLIPLEKDGTKLFVGNGDEATLADLIAEVKNERAIFFNGSGNRGLGSGADAVNVPQDSKNPAKMSAQEKSEYIKKHGAKGWAALLAKHQSAA